MQRPYKVLVMAMQFINLKSAVNSIPNEVAWEDSERMTLREWIGRQSVGEKQDFGVRVVRAFGGRI